MTTLIERLATAASKVGVVPVCPFGKRLRHASSEQCFFFARNQNKGCKQHSLSSTERGQTFSREPPNGEGNRQPDHGHMYKQP